AHADHDVAHAATPTLEQCVTGQAGAGHAERMADRDRAAVHVQAVVRYAELVTAIDDLARERLVDFPKADVGHRESGLLQQFRDREYRPDAHLVRTATGHRHGAIDAERTQTAALRLLAAHDDAGARPVGELRGVARSDVAPFGRPLALLPDRLERRQTFERRVRTNAFVMRERDGFRADHLAF